MILHIWCPGCGNHRTTLPAAAGFWVKCRHCDATVHLPRPGDPARVFFEKADRPLASVAEPAVAEETEYPFRPGWPMLYWLLLSAAWVSVGWNLALLAGSLAKSVALPVLAMTLWLIVGNIARSWRAVRATGYVISALPLTLVQLGLFHLLFFQIAVHLGPHHYAWGDDPTGPDWLIFTGSHVFRAADVFDTADLLGWEISHIETVGYLSGSVLAAFRMLTDLFLIGLIIDALRKLAERRAGSRTRPRSATPARPRTSATLLVATALVCVAFIEGWRAADLILWPLDNCLRVIDFVDLMQMGDLRLHGVEETVLVLGLALAFRVMVAVKIAGPIFRAAQQARLRYLGTVGLSERELWEAAASRDPVIARKARNALDRVDCFSRHAVGIMMSRRGKWAAFVLGGTILASGVLAARHFG